MARAARHGARGVSVSKIGAFRQTIEKVVSLLSERGIAVTQQGTQAMVRYSPDGTPLSVNIPSIPDNADETVLNAIRGFVDHEVGHLLFTDGPLAWGALHREPELKGLFNIVEDTRIERRMRSRFPGTADHLQEMWSFLYTRHAEKTLASATHDNERLGVALPALMHHLAGSRAATDFLHRNNLMELVQPILDRLGEHVARLPELDSTQDALDYARILHDAIKPPAPPCEDEKKDEEKNESEKGGDKLEKDDKPEKSDKPEKGEGDGDKSDEKPDEGSEGEGSEGDDAEEGDDDAEGDGEGDDAGDEEGDGESGKGDTDGEGDGGAEEGESRGESSGKPGGKSSDTGESPGIKPSGNPGDDIDCLEYVEDPEEAMKEALAESLGEAIGRDAYLPYTRDKDRWVKPEPKPGYDAQVTAALNEMDEEVNRTVGHMAAQFRRIFAQKQVSVPVGGQRSGKLMASTLHRISVGDDRVFFRREEHQATNSAVTLLVDCSGSMGGSKIRTAMDAAFAFSRTLEQVGIVHEVLGFTCDSEVLYQTMRSEEYRAATEALGRPFSRVDPILMLEFKTFDETLRRTRQRFASMRKSSHFTPHGLDQNVDGESVQYAAERLLRRPEPRKVLIVFSDGSPCASSVIGSHINAHLKMVVQDVERSGVEVLGIGIEDDSVKTFYGRSVVLNNVADLPKLVMSEISRVLLRD